MSKCGKCNDTGWTPCVEPEGAFLREIPGIKEPCPFCAKGKEIRKPR